MVNVGIEPTACRAAMLLLLPNRISTGSRKGVAACLIYGGLRRYYSDSTLLSQNLQERGA
jgi:hypothetical protein